MHVRMELAGLVGLLSLAACGQLPGSTGEGQDPVRARLLAAADTAATSNGGKAKLVEAVETTRGTAADLTGHSNADQAEKVWVVQVSGDDYSCSQCSHPARGSAPGGKYITLVLRASDYVGTDSGIGPGATDLAQLGHVEVLRDQR
jgi:hypothetical protein